MNREDTKKLIPVMQAYADGKVIQYKSGSAEYKDGFAPNWNWHDDTDVYRVKPEEVPKSGPATDEEITTSLKLIDQYITKEKLTGIIRTSDYLPAFAERYWILNLETKCWEELTDTTPQVEDLPTMTPKEFEKKYPLYRIVRQGEYDRYFIYSKDSGSTFILIDVVLKRFHTYNNILSIEIYDDLKLLYNHYRKELELK